ncbi:hypothetical protein [Rhizobium sp. SSA_523]|uniref:hypothetical protein n=1 Tax=Rhizobium sp. SSA_523 TaxID=2952477 RepID=UPI002090B757|nr:hypothetical protein [Rhizobium sp. SSA_523]MCO5734804.1 hypothetical protein [Rhizobium sp. SSA_523]WKC21057.1 hypothetical protein QTJ18_01115 [Rhizobium sp. SSA_523]
MNEITQFTSIRPGSLPAAYLGGTHQFAERAASLLEQIPHAPSIPTLRRNGRRLFSAIVDPEDQGYRRQVRRRGDTLEGAKLQLQPISALNRTGFAGGSNF